MREAAEMTGFIASTIIRLFERQKGVIVLGCPEAKHKRRYRSVRIRRAVYERANARLIVK